jgi:tRNA pseudouridine65 synthase
MKLMSEFPLAQGVTILEKHETGLIALHKPDGIMSHPNDARGNPKALLTCAYDLASERYHWHGGELFLLHRLDSPTSGVILGCTDFALARAVKKAFEDNAVQKTYRALVFGSPSTKKEIWQDRLEKNGMGSVLVRGKPNALTEMKQISTTRLEDGIFSELELKPKTGKTHQLRVQAAARGLPMIGDATYGDFLWNRAFARLTGHKRLFLHALEVIVKLEWKGQLLEFYATSPLPSAYLLE